MKNIILEKVKNSLQVSENVSVAYVTPSDHTLQVQFQAKNAERGKYSLPLEPFIAFLKKEGKSIKFTPSFHRIEAKNAEGGKVESPGRELRSGPFLSILWGWNSKTEEFELTAVLETTVGFKRYGDGVSGGSPVISGVLTQARGGKGALDVVLVED